MSAFNENRCPRMQKHVHEIVGSTKIAEENGECHNHRFATVSDEAIQICGEDHVHEVKLRTDFFDDHFHEFYGKTSGAIWVGDNRHVHFIKDFTNVEDGHRHAFRVAALIDNPIED